MGVTISPTFQLQVEKFSMDLQKNANSIFMSTGQRDWIQPDPQGWSGSLFDIAGMSKPFSRQDMNQEYTKAISGGKLGDREVSKAQVDYLAAMERAFRARNASSVRCAIHAADRQSGQGSTNGVYRAVRDYLNSRITQSSF